MLAVGFGFNWNGVRARAIPVRVVHQLSLYIWVRLQLIRHVKTCTTDIYLHNECAHVGLSIDAPVCVGKPRVPRTYARYWYQRAGAGPQDHPGGRSALRLNRARNRAEISAPPRRRGRDT